MEGARNRVSGTAGRRKRSGLSELATDSRSPWLLVLMTLFVVITTYVLWRLWPVAHARELLTPFHLVLFSFASYRAGRILANADVARPLRAPFVEVEEDEDGEPEEEPIRRGFRGAIGSLLLCPDCAGFWVAVGLVYSYLFWPDPTRVVAFAIAVNGLGHLLNGVVMVLRYQSGHRD